MRPDIAAKLQLMGEYLNQGVYPLVKNGGFVMPGNLPSVPSSVPGKRDHLHETRRQGPQARTCTSAAPSWQRPPFWERASRARRSWTASEASSLISTDIQKHYESEIDELKRAYPDTQVWWRDEGFWLLVRSSLFDGLEKRAVFLIGIPFVWVLPVRSWAFWESSMALSWIGPRHTNFPDGSICAFDPSDKVWSVGDSIIELIDFYTVWAMRHLHLEKYNRWPGAQMVTHAYERIVETHINELCGCGADKTYLECCYKSDMAINQITLATDFICKSSGANRHPPEEVVNFVRSGSILPSLNNLLIYPLLGVVQ